MASHAPELIDFLDDHWCNVMTAHAVHRPFGDTPEETLQILVGLRQTFLEDLSRMRPEQVLATAHEVMIEQDRTRPFNRFGTEADFGHFGRCAFLSSAEAVALSLGKDPNFVTWDLVRPYLGTSLFALEYAKRLDLIERAVIWQELPEFFSPLDFLTWAHKYKLSVPDAFIECTFARGEPIQYWHDLCAAYAEEITTIKTELHATRDALVALQKVCEECEEEGQRTFDEWLEAQVQIDGLNGAHEEEIASLRDALAQASKNAALLEQTNSKLAEGIQDDAIGTTERKSLLTIVVASAVGGYGYDPKGKKSPVPQDIASEAQRLGLKMTNETVSKYLKEAATLKGFVAPYMDCPKPNSAYQ